MIESKVENEQQINEKENEELIQSSKDALQKLHNEVI